VRLLTGGRGAGGAGLRGGKVHCQCSTEHANHRQQRAARPGVFQLPRPNEIQGGASLGPEPSRRRR
jgi:hypothetical protein